eukprot:CAMPEP_0202713396 /NCGR_PEP_ID=MMETSP1385-20130828/53282_1 /ASSEMBLY_ACC=CAM_ASM_000861 /TAXON_ID=933848 /ORGANISM="Elphidium margaritaceum" /LENGTH=318 /DNA_ID=CAMNT_0049373727 /DNA_START=35 /DNA_END=991 /DNA_ORIENTATION=+
MAVQQAQNIQKNFENVAFPSVQDRYAVIVEFDADADTLSLKFMNKTNTKTFRQSFDKAAVDKITAACTCRLSAQNLCEVIVDQLSSTAFINKCCRVFVFDDMEKATKKSEMYAQAQEVPTAKVIVDGVGDNGNSNDDNKLDGNDEGKGAALLFVAHFNPSKYVRCNYCFVIPEKHLSDMDRFMIKFNELQAENQELRQTLQQMQQKMSRLETGGPMQQISLQLTNSWRHNGHPYSSPKASKWGKIVFLAGQVIGGSSGNAMTTLPSGYRPSETKRFSESQDRNGSVSRVEVLSNGDVKSYGPHPWGWVSLDGIQFIVA